MLVPPDPPPLLLRAGRLAPEEAESHPQKVSELILRGIFTLRRWELEWFYQEGASRLFPDAWQNYIAPIPPEERCDMIAAYYRRLDGWIMRLVDVMLAFPAILIGLAVAAIFGAGLTAVVIALVVATVPDVARVARGAAIGVMGQEFMEAGRAVGVCDRELIWRYLTLNCISTIFVFLTLRFGQIILIGAALGFLGMGAQPPTAELAHQPERVPRRSVAPARHGARQPAAAGLRAHPL